jgi:hypothetical protein
MTTPSISRAFLAEARRRLADRHDLIRHCLGQLGDAQVWWRPHPALNSIANIVLHLCGNLRQWIVAGVGGAPDVRNRPQEFAEREPLARDELLRRLAEAVAEADDALARVGDQELLEPRRVQGFDLTVLSAVFDSLSHLAGHTQEIVYVTRLQLGDAYRFAWTPATPEQGAAPAGGSGAETVAARDAVFEQGLEPPAGGTAAAPVGGYLRDLQQEFQDQEEEGKL